MLEPTTKDVDIKADVCEHALVELNRMLGNRHDILTPEQVRDIISGICIDHRIKADQLPEVFQVALTEARAAAPGEKRFVTKNLIGSIERA